MNRADMRPVRALLVVLAVAVSLVACSQAGGTPPSPSSSSSPASSSAPRSSASGPFVLTVTVPRTTWSADEPIELRASLAYDGAKPTVMVAGSGSGLIGFGLKELTGRREIEGLQTADCRAYNLDRAAPIETSYKKSGGFSETDPDRDWKRQFITDPQFRLPAGRWRVTTSAEFYEVTCGSDAVRHEMRVSIDLTVT